MQKAAYDMRISDWSSDVCSSDLNHDQREVVADGSTFPMRPGQSATLGDHSVLRYERLVNDSRCMPDVQCIWAGDAELAFEWRAGTGPAERFSLHTGKGAKSHALGERTLVLVSVARGPAPRSEEHTSELQSLMRI